jgi:hypothetical protein
MWVEYQTKARVYAQKPRLKVGVVYTVCLCVNGILVCVGQLALPTAVGDQ